MAQQNRLAFHVPLGASAPAKEETTQSTAPQNHRNDCDTLTGKMIDTYSSAFATKTPAGIYPAQLRLAIASGREFSPFFTTSTLLASVGVQTAIYYSTTHSCSNNKLSDQLLAPIAHECDASMPTPYSTDNLWVSKVLRLTPCRATSTKSLGYT
eukprot:scaffold373427_cov19-Prasinocladus_malaysianus.AAC.1